MLHFLVIRSADAAFSADRMPPTSVDTPTVLLNITSGEGLPPVADVLIAGDGQSFRTKRTRNTFMACFEEPSDLLCDGCEMSADDYEVFSWVDINEGSLVTEAITEIMKLVSEGTGSTKLEAMRNKIVAEKTFKRRRLGADGKFGPSVNASLSGRPTGPPRAPNFDATERDDIINLIETIDPAIKYLGFNAHQVRESFLKSRPDNDEAARDLILIFAGYAHVGNNAGKLNDKRVDMAISKQVANKLTNMGVMKRSTTADGMTLARAGIAFMAEYILYRRFLTTGLQDQTESSLSVVYKDICFYGCPEIRSMTGYENFHKEFSSFIYKPREDTPLDDPKFLSSYRKWNKVAAKGYITDRTIHSKVSAAISAPESTSKTSVLETIAENLQNYRAHM